MCYYLSYFRVISIIKMMTDLLLMDNMQASSSLPAMLRAIANTLWNLHNDECDITQLQDLGLNEELFK